MPTSFATRTLLRLVPRRAGHSRAPGAGRQHTRTRGEAYGLCSEGAHGNNSINASAKIFMPRGSGWLIEFSISVL